MRGRNGGQSSSPDQVMTIRLGQLARLGLLGVLLLAVSAGCASYTLSRDDLVLARVNGQAITLQEVKEEFQRTHQGHLRFLGTETELSQFVNRVVEIRLLIEEAYLIGLDRDPPVLAAVQEYKRNLMVQAIYRDEVQAKATVSEEELKAFHSQLVERVSVHLIQVSTRAEAEQIKEALAAGASFAQLAKERSLGRKAESGGDLGFVTAGMLNPALEKVAFTLPEGQTSEIVASPEGYGILQVKERRTGQLPDFTQVRPWMERVLTARQEASRKEEYLGWLRAKQKVKIARELLKPELYLGDKGRDGEPVARFGESWISVGQLRKRLNSEALAKLDPRVAAEEIEYLLKEMIDEELLFQRAKARGYGQKAEILSQVRRREERIILARLYKEVLMAGLKVEEEEAKRYYHERQNQFATPEMVRVGHILGKSEEEAKELRTAIAAGASFEELARAKSKDLVTAQKGGEIGWVVKGQLPHALATFEEKAFTLAPGEVSEPVASAQGFHLIKVWEKIAPRQRPYETVSNQLKKKLLQEKQQARERSWLEKLKGLAQISLEKEAVAKAVTILNEQAEKRALSRGREREE